jgi:acyl-CoA thioester hydrolase
MKDDARRRDPAAYPASQTLETRFGDMDVNGHLNNVAFARLFE